MEVRCGELDPWGYSGPIDFGSPPRYLEDITDTEKFSSARAGFDLR